MDEPYPKPELVEDIDLGGKPAPRSDTLERPQIQGRPPTELYLAYERDLCEADIAALAQPRAVVRPRSLTRIHASHHALARCLAAGMRPQQAALVTGYSPNRISALQRDEAFIALVADYRAEVKSIFADMAERMSNMSLDAMEMLQERLHESPDTFGIGDLMDIIKSFADRTGYGPNTKLQVSMDRDYVDRPPRESYDEWQARRTRELEGPEGPKTVN